MRHIKQKHDVLIFTLILWVWTWLGGYIVQLYFDEVFTGIFFLLSSLLLPLIFLRIRGESLRDIGVHFNMGQIRFYLGIIISYVVIFGGIVILGSSIVFKLAIQLDPLVNALLTAPLVLILITLQTFMEEISWSGWLFDKLSSSYYQKTLIISGIWIIWHLPFFFWTDQLVMLLPNFRVEVLLVLILHFTVARFLFNWFRAHSNNTLWPSIIHGVSNLVAYISGAAVGELPTSEAYVVFLLVILGNGLFSVVLHLRYGVTTQLS